MKVAKLFLIMIVIYLIFPFAYIYGVKLATDMACPNHKASNNTPVYTLVMTDHSKCTNNLYTKFGIYWFLKHYPRPPLEIYQFKNI